MATTATITVQHEGFTEVTHAYGSYKAPITNQQSSVVLANTDTQGVDSIYSATLAISTESNTTVDLASATGITGTSHSFARVMAIIMDNTGTVDVSFGGGSDGSGTNAFDSMFGDASDILVIPAGRKTPLVAPANGWLVSGATGGILRFANADDTTAAALKLTIIGQD